MFRVYAVYLVLAVLCSVAHGLPMFKSDIKSCYKQLCPEDTLACEKISKMTRDRNKIVSEVHCLGSPRGNVLKNITSNEPNPYGPSIIFQSYSYRGTYEVVNADDNSVDAVPVSQSNKEDANEIDINNTVVKIPKSEHIDNSNPNVE